MLDKSDKEKQLGCWEEEKNSQTKHVSFMQIIWWPWNNAVLIIWPRNIIYINKKVNMYQLHAWLTKLCYQNLWKMYISRKLLIFSKILVPKWWKSGKNSAHSIFLKCLEN